MTCLQFPTEAGSSPYPADERKPKTAFMQRSGTLSNDGPQTLPWEHRGASHDQENNASAEVA
jgi:hypothetical protein